MRRQTSDGFITPSYAYARSNPLTYTDPTGLYPDPFSAGKLCTSSSCKPGDTESCKTLPEDTPKVDTDDPKNVLLNAPEPGTCVDADAVYRDGVVVKIPNHCKCTIECGDNGRESISCVCIGPIWDWWKGPAQDVKDKMPPGWPRNPFASSGG